MSWYGRRRRFSKLKARIESLFDATLNMQIRCTVYQKREPKYWTPSEYLRFWITLDKVVIYDLMKDTKHLREKYADNGNQGHLVTEWDTIRVNSLIQEYIETPIDLLFDHVFQKDIYGVTDILKAADRRIGKRRLRILYDRTTSQIAKEIIEKRDRDIWMDSYWEREYAFLFRAYKLEDFQRTDDFGFGWEHLCYKEINVPTELWIYDGSYLDFSSRIPFVIVFGLKHTVFYERDHSKMIPVSISENPKPMITKDLFDERTNMSSEDWDIIYDFIQLNCNELLDYWNGKYHHGITMNFNDNGGYEIDVGDGIDNILKIRTENGIKVGMEIDLANHVKPNFF